MASLWRENVHSRRFKSTSPADLRTVTFVVIVATSAESALPARAHAGTLPNPQRRTSLSFQQAERKAVSSIRESLALRPLLIPRTNTSEQRRIHRVPPRTRTSTVAVTWREYHESTKHSVESLRRAPHVLDWANMPDPFRHYEGVPVLDLPADPPAPETPALEVLGSVSGCTPAVDGPRSFRNCSSIPLRLARPSAFRPPDTGTPCA